MNVPKGFHSQITDSSLDFPNESERTSDAPEDNPTATGRETAGQSLISPNEAAQWLGVKPEVLAQWRYRGIGPAFVRFNERSVRYRPTVIREWVASRETTG